MQRSPKRCSREVSRPISILERASPTHPHFIGSCASIFGDRPDVGIARRCDPRTIGSRGLRRHRGHRSAYSLAPNRLGGISRRLPFDFGCDFSGLAAQSVGGSLHFGCLGRRGARGHCGFVAWRWSWSRLRGCSRSGVFGLSGHDLAPLFNGRSRPSGLCHGPTFDGRGL